MEDTESEANHAWYQEHGNCSSYQHGFGRPDELVTFHESTFRERPVSGKPWKHPFLAAEERDYLIAQLVRPK